MHARIARGVILLNSYTAVNRYDVSDKWHPHMTTYQQLNCQTVQDKNEQRNPTLGDSRSTGIILYL